MQLQIMTTLRVGIPLADAQAPFFFPCAFIPRNQFRRTPGCSYPGSSVEIIRAILGDLHYSFTPVDFDKDKFDLTGFSASADFLSPLNLSTTIPVANERIAVIMSDRPVSQHALLTALFHPFDYTIWLAILVLIFFRRGYPIILKCLEDYSKDCTSFPSFQPSASGTVLSTTMGVMLLTALYRNGLLTRLMNQQRRFLVEDINDLADLPKDIQVNKFCCQILRYFIDID